MKEMDFVKTTKKSKATGEGSHHWLWQRKTAIANLILAPWLAISFILIEQDYYKNIEDWLKLPMNSLFLVLFFLSTLYHGTLGIKVVIEDYVRCNATKILSIIFLELLAITLFFAAVFSIANIYFNFSV